MTLDKLNYLLMVCEEQNITKAAKRLYITQPTLTTYLNNLERSLGFRIFDRTHTPVLLTRSGKQYIEQMRHLLAEESRIIDEIRIREQNRATIRIGIGHVHSQMLCPDLISRLLEEKPELNVVIRESQEKKLMEFLRNDEIDVVFGHLEIDTVNFTFESLFEENLFIIIPENLLPGELLLKAEENGLAQNSISNPFFVPAEVLNALPIIEPMKSQGLYLNLKQMFEQCHVQPVKRIQTANMITAAGLVERGVGYMYISHTVFSQTHSPHPQRIYYCTMPGLARSRKYYIGYKHDNPNLETILRMKAILRQLPTT